MACRVEDKPFAGIIEVPSEQGFAGLREALERLLNEVAKASGKRRRHSNSSRAGGAPHSSGRSCRQPSRLA